MQISDLKVIKRSGDIVDFDKDKIIIAITKSNNEIEEAFRISQEDIEKIANSIEEYVTMNGQSTSVEEIQDMVEDHLMVISTKVARAYIRYRYNRELLRKANTTDQTIKELLDGNNEYWNKENSNKNAKLVTTQRDYIAGITSTDIARRFIFPKDAVAAHDKGAIHIHDMDYAAEQTRHNCELCNLNDMLQNGTVINGIQIEKPHRFITAMTIATQIIVAVSSASYGGITVTMTHLAPFVRSSHERHLKKYLDFGLDEEQANKLADIDTRREVKDGVQTFNYQVNSMSSTNGQAPFLTVSLYTNETQEYKKELALIIEEFLKQRIEGMKNDKGVPITIAFPKLIYILDEDNVHPNSPYYYLTELAAKCTAKRLVPDYVSAKIMREEKINKYGNGDVYAPMGCRSFLTPYHTNGNISNALDYVEGEPRYYGRFNCGVVTLNLPYIAFEASVGTSSEEERIENFWRLLDEYAEMAHRTQQIRIERLSNTTSDVAPILWQHGALARLNPGETLYPLIHNHYATISLGYSGLYECIKKLTGKSHTENTLFATKVMERLNNYCAKWKQEEGVDYSLYGTPMESGTQKFANAIRRDFGEDAFIELDGHDRQYITNSAHIPVFEEIDAFEKLQKESPFQKLSPGGNIVYCETCNLNDNIPAVLEVIKFIYDNVMYGELNTKSDYCKQCGYDGEIELLEEDGKFYYHCPNCGNEDHKTMNIARRVCGYISTNLPNNGRLGDIHDRYVHIDNHDCC